MFLKDILICIKRVSFQVGNVLVFIASFLNSWSFFHKVHLKIRAPYVLMYISSSAILLEDTSRERIEKCSLSNRPLEKEGCVEKWKQEIPF